MAVNIETGDFYGRSLGYLIFKLVILRCDFWTRAFNQSATIKISSLLGLLSGTLFIEQFLVEQLL